MGKLDEMWEKTTFKKGDPGEEFVEQLISEAVHAPLVDLADDTPLPDYYDAELFKKGQDYYKEYELFIATGHVLGVTILFGVESILDILSCTKQSSTPVTAYKRYGETLLYIENFFRDSPEDRKSKCFRSILAVRKKHQHGSAMGLKRVNRFINQRDMVVTQNSFMGYALKQYTQFGMPFEPEKLFAMCHLWRVIGFMLGIEEKYNLCSGDLATITARSHSIFRHIIVPGLLNRTQEFQPMTDAYFNGLLGLSTNFEPVKFLFITLSMTNVPGFYLTEDQRADQLKYLREYSHYAPQLDAIEKEMEEYPVECKAFKELKWSYRWDIKFTNFLLLSVVPNSWIVKSLMNLVHYNRLFFFKHLPILGILKFGYQKAYVRVLEDEVEL